MKITSFFLADTAEEAAEAVLNDIKQTPQFLQKIIDKLTDLLPQLISAVLIYIAGRIVDKIVLKLLENGFKRSKLDKTVHGFIKSAVHILILCFTIIIALSTLGIPMTSIIAAVSAAGLAIGLALQNSLSNVAGGFIVLFSKPFRAGDYIAAGGVEGTVQEISIINTKIMTVDNKAVYIPNGTLSGATITNYTHEKTRRVDMIFGISYGDDYKKAIDIVKKVISQNSKILASPVPEVRVNELGSSSVNLIAKAWVAPADYWDVYYWLNENVKSAFDENGITIPFTTVTVRQSK